MVKFCPPPPRAGRSKIEPVPFYLMVGKQTHLKILKESVNNFNEVGHQN